IERRDEVERPELQEIEPSAIEKDDATLPPVNTMEQRSYATVVQQVKSAKQKGNPKGKRPKEDEGAAKEAWEDKVDSPRKQAPEASFEDKEDRQVNLNPPR
ncbi:hypothetical protein MAR_015699, partial [Mya arenaria]